MSRLVATLIGVNNNKKAYIYVNDDNCAIDFYDNNNYECSYYYPNKNLKEVKHIAEKYIIDLSRKIYNENREYHIK